jgi:cytochrome b
MLDRAGTAVTRVRIWDLPTRLFHWTLLVLVVTSFVTGRIGGNAMKWHMLSGYTILTLIVFRLLWGMAGSHYARFAEFVRGPRAVLAYLLDTVRGTATSHAGHNPLGALSVLALLAALLLQASTGLFSNDDIANEGPLAKLVSGAVSEILTSIHRFNKYIILGLVALHLAAIAFYYFAKRENLVRPMITGDRHGIQAPPAVDDLQLRLRALVLLALAAGLIAYTVNL